ncbi:MAG TPA: NAD-dependent deacylase [Trueperaceae bacterium]|nr:NAD-dependent deacylase [Propioniciclava sp.]HLV11287.1 NAD-dependent deacylase [Trueperaceae bacterium]
MRIVVLTGAGISAESGLRTFRDEGGLWEGHDVRDVATPEAFARDPDLVQRFYDARRRQLREVVPNAAHLALARLEDEGDHDVLLVTQNVDDLHERAGSRKVLHMHGELLKARCLGCGERVPWHDDLVHRPPCPRCGRPSLRPDVVWFGEVPHHLDEIQDALWESDVFAAIGTSGLVYPAAGFVRTAAAAGARTVEMNLGASAVASAFDEVREGPATVTVPAWVDELLG